jgi:hypothetical protein
MAELGNQLLLQRILRKPTSSGGGGSLTANSVDSSHIINGSIVGTDLATNITIGNNLTVTNELVVNGATSINSISSFNDELIVNGTSTFNNVVNIATTDFYFAAFGINNPTTGTGRTYGTATLVAGTVTITNSFAGSNTIILVTRNNVVTAANMGHLYVVKATGSFQIVSTNVLDNNAVDYLLFFAL